MIGNSARVAWWITAGPALLQAAWILQTLLALLLFIAGLVYQVQNGFWQIPSEQAMAASPILARVPIENRFLLDNGLYPFVLAATYIQTVAFAIVGLFLFWRRSRDAMGVLASWMLIAIGLGFTPTVVLLPVLEPAWHLPTSLFQAALFGSAFLFLCLFPNGRFFPHWTRYIAAIWLGYVLLWLPLPQLNPHRAGTILAPLLLMIVLWLGVAAQLLRYHHKSSQEEKQQTKWVIAGFAAANFSLFGIVLLLSLATTSPTSLLIAAILLLGVIPICIPITISVALLRYRLWRIDVILNRSLLYGGLSLGIVTIYALTVGTLSLLFQSPNNLLISLLATGLIAVLFQPLRERLQLGVNRLMFGNRDEPYAVLSKLGTQLQTTTPEAMLQSVVETIATTLKLPYVAIKLVDEQGHLGGAVTGRAGAEMVDLPLRYQNETVGYLVVSPRSPGELFTARERQLLTDMAGQTGAMAYAVRLTAALQRSREQMVLAREEERRRIRRDLHDGLGPTLASQTFAFDAILELLETNPQEAARLLRGLKSQNQETVAEIRRLVYQLRPPALDELGLLDALKAHGAHLNNSQSLQVQITARPEPLPPLTAAMEVAAYRIVVEAITNVVRHAKTQRCEVCLTVVGNGRSHLHLEVSDDGIGLPSKLRPGVGLSSMRERVEELGGSCKLEANKNGGTRITAVLPISVRSEPDR